MRWRGKTRFTLGGLLVFVTACALAFALMRSPRPPDEGEAILLAKAHLQARNEFDYPRGYWARAVWDPHRGAWSVGFVPARKDGGGNLMVDVYPDRTCREGAIFDHSFFQDLYR